MSWVKLTRPDRGPVWLNSKADFWRIIQDPPGTKFSTGRVVQNPTVIWYGDAQQTVLETPEEIIKLLEKA